MAKGASRLSDEIEREWSLAVGTALRGLVWFVVGLLLVYATHVAARFEPLIIYLGYFLALLAILAGLVMMGSAARNAYIVRHRQTVPVTCPYCGETNQFLTKPTEDFTCEGCARDVHFLGGTPVPVQTIVCQACKAEHRVAVSVDRYICDKCNRPLRIVGLDSQPADKPAVARVDTAAAEAANLSNQDVLLTAYDTRRENDLAFRLQDLLLLNATETRRLLKLATKSAPLIVGFDLAPLKADAIRRQLIELGATVHLRTASAGTHTAGRTG